MGALFSLVISPDTPAKVYELRKERCGNVEVPSEEVRTVYWDGGVKQIRNPDSEYHHYLGRWGVWMSFYLLIFSVFINVPMLTVEHYRKIHDPPDYLWLASCYSDWQSAGLAYWRLHECVHTWEGRILAAMMVFETLGLVLFLFLVLRSAYIIWSSPSGFRKWHHMDALWCDWLPMLGRFSAIKFLGKAHPAFLVLEFRRGVSHVLDDVQEMLEDVEDHPMDNHKVKFCIYAWATFQLAFNVTYAILLRVVVFTCGFAAFIAKVTNVRTELLKTEGFFLDNPYLWKTFVSIAFLNQALNMVDINRRLFDRSLRFVFAGENALYEKHEWNLRACYKAEVAEELYTTFAVGQNRPLYFVATLVNFDHLDVQRLAFQSEKSLKQRRKRPSHLKPDNPEYYRPDRLCGPAPMLQACEDISPEEPGSQSSQLARRSSWHGEAGEAEHLLQNPLVPGGNL